MWDFIFIIGTSGIGKSTLAKGLLNKLKTVVIEQNMIPEFLSRDGHEEMTGELEELTCWENTKALAFCFHKLGYRNIIITDLDDLRTADIPIDFKGYKYITIKLVCSDLTQLQKQMMNLPEGGLIDLDLQQKCNDKNISRALLPNEHLVDIVDMSKADVLDCVLNILNNAVSITDYEYQKPDKQLFYSWVFSNGLR